MKKYKKSKNIMNKLVGIFKRIFTIFTFSSSIVFITSCLSFFETNHETVDRLFASFVSAIDTKDMNAVKKLFAKEKIDPIDNFDEDIALLFKYYEGESISTYWMNLITTDDKDGEFVSKSFEFSYNIITNVDTYKTYFVWYSKYSTNKNLEGIWSFYIIRKDEDNFPEEYAYGGDGYKTPGINIGKVWSKDDGFD